MPDTPLNPDALEAARFALTRSERAFGRDGKPADPLHIATAIVSAYLAVAQPSARYIELIKRLTTERDRARQGLNDQRREFRRLRESDLANGRTRLAQPEMNNTLAEAWAEGHAAGEGSVKAKDNPYKELP